MPLTVTTERTGGQDNLPEPGVYRARVEAIEERPGTEFPYAACTLRLQVPDSATGMRVWDNISMAPKARFKVEQVLDALGIEEGVSFDLMTMRNKVVFVEVGHDTYNGRLRLKVSRWVKPEEGQTLAEEQNHLTAAVAAATASGAGRRPAGRTVRRPATTVQQDEDGDEFPV